jgi:hypothetical protein
MIRTNPLHKCLDSPLSHSRLHTRGKSYSVQPGDTKKNVNIHRCHDKMPLTKKAPRPRLAKIPILHVTNRISNSNIQQVLSRYKHKSITLHPTQYRISRIVLQLHFLIMHNHFLAWPISTVRSVMWGGCTFVIVEPVEGIEFPASVHLPFV